MSDDGPLLLEMLVQDLRTLASGLRSASQRDALTTMTRQLEELLEGETAFYEKQELELLRELEQSLRGLRRTRSTQYLLQQLQVVRSTH